MKNVLRIPKKIKTKTVYWVTAKTTTGLDVSQYLLPGEIYLIKTMLKNGFLINGVRLDKLNAIDYRLYFDI